MKLADCPVHHTLRFIGGKWKPIILYYLKQGTLRSAQLARKIPDVSAKVLTAQLRELERDGIVARHTYPTVPPRVEYSLTELGESLRPVLKELAAWGAAHGRKRARV